jgi:transposase
MNDTITYRIGFDVAKGVFQAHAVKNEPGEPVAFTRRLKRAQVEAFFATLPRSLIGMEACGSAHYWARVARKYGHEVRLMPPAYVKAYLKRNKTDALDAEAICEAVGRPTMRFVPIKGEADQAMVALHRMRASFVEKRTAAGNQLRGELAEFGIVAPVGKRGLSELLALVETEAEGFVHGPARSVAPGAGGAGSAMEELRRGGAPHGPRDRGEREEERTCQCG